MLDKRYYHPIDFVEIGLLTKAFGLKGHLRYELPNSVDIDLSTAGYIWIDCYGCFVPFEINEVDLDRQLILFGGIDSLELAKIYGQKKIALPRQQLNELQTEEELTFWLIGFQLVDKQSGLEGSITEQQELGPQIMLTVKVGDKDYWVPIVEEWILEIDPEKKVIEMELPLNMFSNPIGD